MVKFVNLTPHEIVVVGENKEVKTVILPSGEIARVKIKQEFTTTVEGIPVVKTIFYEVEGLPEPQSDTIYIVSSLVAQAVPHREDVVAPDTSPEGVVRDSEGRIIGVKRFQKW